MFTIYKGKICVAHEDSFEEFDKDSFESHVVDYLDVDDDTLMCNNEFGIMKCVKKINLICIAWYEMSRTPMFV